MHQEPKDCVWCGSELNIPVENQPQELKFCPDCHAIYETEAHRSLHPVEMRVPHND